MTKRESAVNLSQSRRQAVRAILRIPVVAISTAIYTLIGVGLAWGYLRGGWPLQVLLGLVLGGLPFCPYIAEATGRKKAARRWMWGSTALELAMLLLFVTVAGAQLYDTGFFPPLERDRLATVDRLWGVVRDNYPPSSSKEVDWDGVYAYYQPKIAAAESEEKFFSLVAAMLSELDDGHTGLRKPCLETLNYWAILREVEGQPVVIWSTAEVREAGLEVGSIVVEVDNLPVEHFLGTMPVCLRTASTPWKRRSSALHYLLTDLVAERKATFLSPTGERKTIVLTGPMATRAVLSEPLEDSTPLIVGVRLPSGFGLIRIPTFGLERKHSLVCEFDAALDDLLDTPGLIVDLRGNAGGYLDVATSTAGRFTEQPLVFGQFHFRERLPYNVWQLWRNVSVSSRLPLYQGGLVLLADTGTASAAEIFAAGLQDSGRAVVMGRRTAGSTNAARPFRLSDGGEVYYSAGDYRRSSDGATIEGTGVVPDLIVEWTIEDVRRGRDPDLAAAEVYLLETVGETK